MELQIAKWGNSLALRIPAEFIRQMGLSEGAHVQVNIAPDGSLIIHRESLDRRKFAAELSELRQTMPKSQSVMDEVRRGKGARY